MCKNDCVEEIQLDVDTIPEILEKFRKEAGRTLRQIRKEKGISQEKLALDIGIHPVSLSKIERGIYDASTKTLFQICWGMKISMSVFATRLEERLLENKVETHEKD